MGLSTNQKAEAAQIEMGDFGNNAIVEDYENIGFPTGYLDNGSNINGDIYRTNVTFKEHPLQYGSNSGLYMGRSGAAIAGSTQNTFFDITLSQPVTKIGAWLGTKFFTTSFTVTAQFFDDGDNLLGEISDIVDQTQSFQKPVFLGWEADAGSISRVKFSSLTNHVMLIDDLMKEPGSTSGTVPEPLTILGAAAAVAFGVGFKRKLEKSKNN